MSGAVGPPRRFSIAKLALIIPWVALVIDAWAPIQDNSFLWHVRAGTLQADLGRVLVTDPFSFTRAGARWFTQSWLAELLYGWAEGLSGLGFVPWMLLATTTLTFVGIGLIAFRHSRSVTATAYVLILSTLLLISFLVPRPVIFSFLLFVLVILAWERPGTRWALPFLFWIWASTHGSFAIGLAYIGLSLIMELEWKALGVVFVSGIATLLTAHGLGVVTILIDFAGAGDSLALLTEWRRPTLDSPVFLSFLGGVAFIVVGAYRRMIGARQLWLIVPFLVLGLSSLRALPPAWLGLLPVVALALSGVSLGSRGRLGRGPALIFGVAVLAMPFLLLGRPELENDRFPLEASLHLSDVPVFHDDRVGGFLIWAQWPERQVYLDDRAELYGQRIEEFVQVRNGEKDWRPVFERDEIGQALLARGEALVGKLEEAGWKTTFEDEDWVLLTP